METADIERARAFVQSNVDFSRHDRPNRDGATLFVTLTYAQSLDGKISLPGQKLLLSGTQSLAMTHRLRGTHSAILVGIGTVLVDDPRLQTRYTLPGEKVRHPRPIVLDPHLRFPLDAQLLQNPEYLKPWVIAGPDHDADRRKELEARGARVMVVGECDEQGRPMISAVLGLLESEGVSSLMVEGGAQIIQAFLECRMVDCLIVTIAPTVVGSSGVPAVPSQNGIPGLCIRPRAYEQFGPDVVMIADI
ncbi:2,5-diamino-6-(ribosylamino)-4(3H)-pyrimidinone 5'-phosphate reductase [Coemansia sp. RSA 2703]|nr:2,5-diamino-6-(ribosylamino)-4(3H)-pyrimidinone 5'-phosphate reductase [Coemansia sp. RSA 2703]KAJ2378568.1 2,5-diamino-6-(ribosylamino)-4(3H)-pyrimidinone 5'-phosphate reductase [Coemansia sp. RSA 2607]KAJ2396708.1 2,5-diamino-6-(ribosylamino)-4(3H)-pyrimidinone 5'-phosphate reductase [Coemansia sp. RSA 2603]